MSSLGSWGRGRGLMSSTCREGKLAPPVLGHLGAGGSPSTVVGRLIYSPVNIRERNSDTFPIKIIKCISGPYVGLPKLYSAQLCVKLKKCRVPTG